MNRRDIALLSFKLMAVYALICAMQTLNYLIILGELFNSPINKNAMMIIVASSVLPFLLLVFIGVLLWNKSKYMAAFIFPELKEAELNTHLNIDDIQVMAFSILGAFVLINAVPQLIQSISSLIMIKDFDSGVIDWFMEGIVRIAFLLVKVLVGVWLLLGSRGILGLVRRLREAGLTKQN